MFTQPVWLRTWTLSPARAASVTGSLGSRVKRLVTMGAEGAWSAAGGIQAAHWRGNPEPVTII